MKHLFISFLLLPIQTNPFHLPVTVPIESHSKLVHNNIANNENGNVEDITIEQYSRCLSPKEEKQSIKREASLYSIVDAMPRWQRVLSEFYTFVFTHVYFGVLQHNMNMCLKYSFSLLELYSNIPSILSMQRKTIYAPIKNVILVTTQGSRFFALLFHQKAGIFNLTKVRREWMDQKWKVYWLGKFSTLA